jgi:hypothetical protein
LTILGQVLLVQIGGRAVRTQPLTIYQHIGCLLIASLSLIIGAIIKTVIMAIGIDDDDAKKKLEIRKSLSRTESRITRTMSIKKN